MDQPASGNPSQSSSPSPTPNSPPPAPPSPPPAPAGEDYRARFEAAQKELDKIKRGQMSENERLKAELSEAQQFQMTAQAELKSARIRSAFDRLAGQHVIHDPEAAFKLADLSKVAVSETGEVSGVEMAIEILRKTKPYLFGPKQGIGGSGGLGPPTPQGPPGFARQMDTWIRNKIFGG